MGNTQDYFFVNEKKIFFSWDNGNILNYAGDAYPVVVSWLRDAMDNAQVSFISIPMKFIERKVDHQYGALYLGSAIPEPEKDNNGAFTGIENYWLLIYDDKICLGMNECRKTGDELSADSIEEHNIHQLPMNEQTYLLLTTFRGLLYRILELESYLDPEYYNNKNK